MNDTTVFLYPLFQLVALSAVVAVAFGSDPYQAPRHGGYAPEYPDVDPKYQYAYAVKDDYSGANFAQQEQRDGYNTQGYYRVVLPDGRTQLFEYADNGDGNVAKVTYEGEPRYDKYEPKPSYKSAPAPYKSAPTYAQPSYAPAPHPRPAYAPAPRKYH